MILSTILTIVNPFKAFNTGVCDNRNTNKYYNYNADDGNKQWVHFFPYCRKNSFVISRSMI